MGKRAQDPGVQLAQKFYDEFEKRFGYVYGGVWPKSTSIMSAFWRRYPDAEQIIEFVFGRKRGLVDGKPVTVELFAMNSDWRVQQVRNELRAYEVEDREAQRLRESGGWLDGDSFNNRKTVGGRVPRSA